MYSSAAVCAHKRILHAGKVKNTVSYRGLYIFSENNVTVPASCLSSGTESPAARSSEEVALVDHWN